MKRIIRILLGLEPDLKDKPEIGNPKVRTVSNATGDRYAAGVYLNPLNTK